MPDQRLSSGVPSSFDEAVALSSSPERRGRSRRDDDDTDTISISNNDGGINTTTIDSPARADINITNNITIGDCTATDNNNSRTNADNDTRTNYAFLVHSQDTFPGNLPPRMDNKILVRQKRRRTSPQDQAILEAEYNRNNKPDKVARLTISNRVALGEKEVQIWFQNRRQNVKRKAKPLTPGELPRAITNGATPALPSLFPVTAWIPRIGRRDSAAIRQTDAGGTLEGQRLSSRLPKEEGPFSIANGLSHGGPVSRSVELPAYASQGVPAGRPTRSSTGTWDPYSAQSAHVDDVMMPQLAYTDIVVGGRAPEPTSNGSWSGSDALGSRGPRQRRVASVVDVRGDLTQPSSDSGRPSPSSVWLRTSTVGKAEVVSTPGDSVNLPLPPLRRVGYGQAAGLQRCQSAIVPGGSWERQHSGTSRAASRASAGARRAAVQGTQGWNVFCDRIGPVARPIADPTVVHGNVFKTESRSTTPAAQSARVRLGPADRKLGRANSSLARLQTADGGKRQGPSPALCDDDPTICKGSPTRMASPSGDSDKENWDPDKDSAAGQRAPGRRKLRSDERRRSIFEDSGLSSRDMPRLTRTVQDEDARVLLEDVVASRRDGSLDAPKTGDAVGAMDAAHRTRPQEGLELACLQGLLSLSQGSRP